MHWGQKNRAPGSGIIGAMRSFYLCHERISLSTINESASPQQSPVQHTLKPAKKRGLRIALFGFGTVGGSVARILVESKPEGLELTHIFNRGVARKRVDWVPE